MKNFFKYFAGTLLLVIVMLFFLIPANVELFEFSWLILAVSILSYLFIPWFLKTNVQEDNKINLGLIYFSTMALIIVVGNLSTYVIQFVYPSFDTDLKTTNFYWLAGMFFFSIGYLFITRKISRKSHITRSLYPINESIIIFIFILSLLGTAAAYFNLGFIPFIEGAGTGQRYSGSESNSILDRLWSFCVASATLAYMFIHNVKRNMLMFLVLFGSILLSLFFIIRIYPFLTVLVLFILWYMFEQKKIKIFLFTTVSLVLFFIFNIIFVDYRSDYAFTKVQESSELNFIQRRLIYGTFNEFGQLKEAINRYDAKPQYGMTLLSLPLGFIPGPFLAAIGIEKDKLQKNNSAVLMAKFLESKGSGGIRIGILGEFFINFRFYGCILMLFIGFFIGYLQRKMSAVDIRDWRLAFYAIFFGIMIYALIGQIDAIGSLLGNYLLLFIFIKIFSKKRIVLLFLPVER